MKRKNLLLVLGCASLGAFLISFGFPLSAKISAGAETPSYNLHFQSPISVDETGCGSTTQRYSVICFCKAKETENSIVSLNKRGICYNPNAINSLHKIAVSFEEDGFPGATLFYGNYCLTDQHSIELQTNNIISIPEGNSFFVIQANGDDLVLKDLSIDYHCLPTYTEKSLPKIAIETKDGKPINSRSLYTDSTISVLYPGETYTPILGAEGGVRIRGNSTATCPKKPYRIKFDKKQSFFGLPKNKSWALLADYMDASKMHNYTAFTFSQMVRAENEFTAHPYHVELSINGVSQGIYLLTEQMDEKPGRMDLGQTDGYFTSLFDEGGTIRFNEFPFMIERDYSATTDPLETLDITYFELELSNNTKVYYSLKYPEREDFVNVDEFGEVICDEEDNPIIDNEKFQTYFDSLKAYMLSVEEDFLKINSGDTYDRLSLTVDFESLASFGLTDLFMAENDHSAKSSKLYRAPNGKLKFGPTWDYDSCTLMLGYTGKPIDNPPLGSTLVSRANSYRLGDRLAGELYGNPAGKQLFKDCWQSVSDEARHSFKSDFASEIESISEATLADSDIWYSNASMVFDNIRYMEQWVDLRLAYLDDSLK